MKSKSFVSLTIFFEDDSKRTLTLLSESSGKSFTQIDKHKSEKGDGYHNGNYTDKVHITSVVNENDNCLLKRISQKRENIDDFKIFNEYFAKGSKAVCDSNTNFIRFLKENDFIPDIVKPKPTYNNYASENGYSLSGVNQLRHSLSEMIYKTHGVSLRHLQGYLN